MTATPQRLQSRLCNPVSAVSGDKSTMQLLLQSRVHSFVNAAKGARSATRLVLKARCLSAVRAVRGLRSLAFTGGLLFDLLLKI